MTTDKLVKLCEPLVGSQYPPNVAYGVYRGHWWRDAAAALSKENELLKRSWELPADARIVEAGPNELTVDGWAGSRRRFSMACPKELDALKAKLDEDSDARNDYLERKLDELQAKLAESEAGAAAMREILLPCFALLRHKSISPPMMPGVQEKMEKQAEAALASNAGRDILARLDAAEKLASAIQESCAAALEAEADRLDNLAVEAPAGVDMKSLTYAADVAQNCAGIIRNLNTDKGVPWP